MKIPLASFILTLISVVLLASRTVLATPCTDAEFNAFNKSITNEALAKNCPSAGSSFSVTVVDKPSITVLNPCGEAKCLAYLKSLAVSAPLCEVSGVNVTKMLDALFSLCNSMASRVPVAAKPHTTTNMPTLPVLPTTTPMATATPVSMPLEDSDTTPQATTTSPPLVSPRTMAPAKSDASTSRGKVNPIALLVAIATVLVAAENAF